MLSTVNNIIEISKIETGQLDLHLGEVNLSDVLENQYHFFKPEVERNNMQLILNNELSTAENSIITDELKLNSILTNLIKNAIKYSHEGSITIECKAKDKKVFFSVKDTGIGIEEDRREAIFERFVQADIEDRAAYEGSGLGLAIAKSYAEILGGDIWLESTPGTGSTFYFSILSHPANADIAIMEEEVAFVPKENSKAINVLVAEDDSVSFMLVEIILADKKYQVFHAENGIQALEIFRQKPEIDVILMDLKMSGMNGFEATKKIRELDQKVPIIAQSAYAFTGDRDKAMACGCSDFISKPINHSELIEKIDSCFIS